MHIIIVGGGIAGLSTYLHLRKHLPNPSTHTITIFESHRPRANVASAANLPPNSIQSLNLDTLSESTAIVGGGLGISPNGMRVLRDLDEDLHDRVVAQGFPAEKFVFKGANGWTLGMQSTSDKLLRKDEKEEVCIASSRHGLWQTLNQYVREKEGENVIKYRKVIAVVRDEASGKIRVSVESEQGGEEVHEADLVVGADGVKSVVRKTLFGGEERYNPIYTGLSGVGGFLNTDIPPYIADNKAMVFEFGGNGFFGYSSGGPPSTRKLMWWSTFETSNLPDTKNIDPVGVKAALLERHKHWKDPIIQEIVRKADVESIYPTWTLGKLPHWGEKGIVLLGDAAHAMDPTTGQGASQAFEDAQTFVLLLSELMKKGNEGETQTTDRDSINEATKLLYEIRSPRVDAIVERGKKISGSKATMGVVAEYFMYCFLWLINKVPAIGKAMLGDVNRELYCWSAKEEIQKALAKRQGAA